MPNNPNDSGLGSNPFNRQYSIAPPGLGSSSNTLNMIMSMLFGNSLFPRPTAGNSIAEMAELRRRSLDMSYIMNRALVQSQFMKTIGVQQSQATAIMSAFAAPGSFIDRAMSPLMGGNPMRAQMGLYADMTGMGYAAFGGLGNVSANETGRMMDSLQSVFYRPRGTGANQSLAGGINYGVSRGFNIEDFSQAFTGAGKYNLLGRGAHTGQIAEFASKQGGVMDAARSLFGSDKNGGELMQEINSLLGSSSVDLMAKGKPEEFERLLRDVKSMTHVAGIGIETVKDIIAEVKSLGDARLAGGLGGLDATRIATKVLGSTSSVLSVMDPSLVRMLGGQTGMVSRGVEREIASMGQPISQQLGALYYQAQQQGNGGMMSYISNYAKTGFVSNGVSGFGEPAYQAFLQQAARRSGQNIYQMMNYAANSPIASRLGLEAAPELGEAGQKATLNQVQNMLGYTYGNSPVYGAIGMQLGMGTPQSYAEIMRTYGGMVRPDKVRNLMARVAAARAKAGGGPISTTALAAIMGTAGDPIIDAAVKNGLDEQVLTTYNPEARNRHRAIKAVIASQSELASTLSREHGDLNAPMGQRLIQGLISGTLGKEGLAGVIDMLGGGKDLEAKVLAGDLHAYSVISGKGNEKALLDRAERFGPDGARELMQLSLDGTSIEDARKLAAKGDPRARALLTYDAEQKWDDFSSGNIQKGTIAYGINQKIKRDFITRNRAAMNKGMDSLLAPMGKEAIAALSKLREEKGLGNDWFRENGSSGWSTYLKQNPDVEARLKGIRGGLSVADSLARFQEDTLKQGNIGNVKAPGAEADIGAFIKELVAAVRELTSTLTVLKNP